MNDAEWVVYHTEKLAKLKAIAERFLLFQNRSTRSHLRPFAIECAFIDLMDVLMDGQLWRECLPRSVLRRRCAS